MNDDMSLIVHMSGQGEVIADKLRQAGYTTLQKITEEKPLVLAKSIGIEPNIANKIINSARNLGEARPVATSKAKKNAGKKTTKAKRKVTKAVTSGKKSEKSEVTTEKKSVKKAKKPVAKPEEGTAERPIFGPLRQVTNSLAAEQEIIEATAVKCVGVAKKSPGIRGKILKEVMARDKFRERLVCHLAKELT